MHMKSRIDNLLIYSSYLSFMRAVELKEPLKEIRLAKGWSLGELARRVGLTRGGIARIEARAHTRPATALRIAGALGVPPYVLFPRMFTEAGCRWSEHAGSDKRPGAPRRNRPGARRRRNA